MNTYTLSELRPGITESFKVTITQKMQDSFRELTGDVNPMHIDPEYVKKFSGGGYTDCLVYGMCTASFYSTLVGVYLPGERCLFQECDIRWPRPVYIGDALTITGKVIEVDERFKRIKIKAHIVNQRGERVSNAMLIVGVRD